MRKYQDTLNIAAHSGMLDPTDFLLALAIGATYIRTKCSCQVGK